MNNLGWLFYKNYYRKIDLRKFNDENFGKRNKKKFDEVNREIFKSSLPQKKTEIEKYFYKKNTNTITLETTYPGLLIGSGYNHEIKNEGELKLGFYFDYTTGLPCIPGSTVKGLLRSVFPGRYKNAKDKKARVGYLKELLGDANISITLDGDENEALKKIEKLELEIFEGKRKEGLKNKTISIYERDTFFDAFPFEMKDKLFYDDYITPHIDKNNPKMSRLKNPKPIRFLKIAPQVKFQFNFKLFDSKIIAKLGTGKKQKLFELILKDIGIGAKTNVGYGQFEN